jgi:hypothetical protein
VAARGRAHGKREQNRSLEEDVAAQEIIIGAQHVHHTIYGLPKELFAECFLSGTYSAKPLPCVGI